MKWNKKEKQDECLTTKEVTEDVIEETELAKEDVTVSSDEASEDSSEELTQSEREELEQLRKERDERNLKEKAYDKLYDNLNLSVRGLDIFIGIMVALFLFVVLKGMGLF